MHRTQPVIVAMNQRIGHGFAESAEINRRNRHAEQSDLNFIFRVVRAEVGFQPLKSLQQRETTKFVEAHRLLCQHLESDFMSRQELTDRRLAPHQQEAGQRRNAPAIRLPRGKPEHTVQCFIAQFQQTRSPP